MVSLSPSHSLLLSFNHSLSDCLTYSHAVIFSTHLFVSCISFPFFAAVIFGQQLSWHACRGRNPPFPWSFCPSLLLYPSIPPSMSCTLVWHWKDQFTRQQLRQASFVSGLPSEKAFFASGELLIAHHDIERLIALLPNLAVLSFSGRLSCWTVEMQSWPAGLGIPLGIDMKVYRGERQFLMCSIRKYGETYEHVSF